MQHLTRIASNSKTNNLLMGIV